VRARDKAARAGGVKAFVQLPFWADLPSRDEINADFEGLVRGAYAANGIVFACMFARLLLFSEARFQWREYRQGRPGNLFGSPELALVETPWPGGVTGELLGKAETDASASGNFYVTRADDAGRLGRAAQGPGLRLADLRPDWTKYVVDSASGHPYAADARLVGYVYAPPGVGGKTVEPVTFAADEVAHYKPVPDPLDRYKGMSWLTPIIRDIEGDKAAAQHKRNLFRRGAMLRNIVSFSPDIDPDDFDYFVAKFKEEHEGPDNAFNTLFIGGGADVTVASANLQELDFARVTAAGENRIAAAAKVPGAIAGLAEGQQGTPLGQGDFYAKRRLFADLYARPHWRMFAAALDKILPRPRLPNSTLPNLGASLWYDDRDIAFLRDDAADASAIQRDQMAAINQGIMAGFLADAVVDAVTAFDLRRLVSNHSGLFSVQMQPALAPAAQRALPAGSGNGNGRPNPEQLAALVAAARERT
jgi:hypothetical protein